MKLIIDRSKWLRGSDDYISPDGYLRVGSKLLRSQDGKMCCLGFLCLALGYSEEEIAGVLLPNVMRDKEKLPQFLREIGSDSFSGKAAKINDQLGVDELREVQLIKLFAEQDIELEFVDRDATPENVPYAGEEHP